MLTHTLPISKQDQLVCDTANEWEWYSQLLLNQYIESYINQCSLEGKKLVLIDLFAGSGVVEWANKKYSSAIYNALERRNFIDHFILLEADADKFEALETRLERDYPAVNVMLLPSSPNLQVDQLKLQLEPFSDRNKFTVLCVSTPASLDLQFDTIAALTAIGMDVLALHRLPESAYRGPRNFINHNLEKISEYLDMMEWAAILDQPQYSLDSLTRLLADLFQEQMVSLGYPEQDFRHRIKVGKKKPEYYLGFYSKGDWAQEMFNKANQVIESQTKLLV
jgi:three-Cys-motif partner protein